MKNKFLIAIILLGIIITIFGSLLKISHFQLGIINGNLLLGIGMFIKVAAIILLIVKLDTNKKDNFLTT
jgi:hypothetical protein